MRFAGTQVGDQDGTDQTLNLFRGMGHKIGIQGAL